MSVCRAHGAAVGERPGIPWRREASRCAIGKSTRRRRSWPGGDVDGAAGMAIWQQAQPPVHRHLPLAIMTRTRRLR